jgi:hypothetical protein
MKETQFIDDKRNSSKLITFTCSCGVPGSIDVQNGPMETPIDCPNPECRNMFEVKFLGRRRAPELEQPASASLRSVG